MVDEPIPTFSARRDDKAATQHQRPLPQLRVASRLCCDTSQGTGELREILVQFQSVINRTMAEITPASSTSGGQTRAAEFMRAMGDAPPPSLCSVCTRNIGASNEKQSDWYSCANCHVVIVSNLTFVHMGVTQCSLPLHCSVAIATTTTILGFV